MSYQWLWLQNWSLFFTIETIKAMLTLNIETGAVYFIAESICCP